jgi:hypothetical protein
VTAKYLDIELQIPPFKYGVDNKTPKFLELNPLGQVFLTPLSWNYLEMREHFES